MGYWENRQADLMYGYMQSAEDAAAEIARAYEAAAVYMDQEIDKIFQRFTSQYGLSEAAAKRILGNVSDLRSLDSLRSTIEASGENADELLAEMNSPAYAARMHRWEDVQASLDDVMQRVYGYEQQVSSECYRNVAQTSYLDTIAGVEEQVGFSFSFAEISPEEIDTVMNMPFLGRNYSQRIWDNTQAVADSVREQMLIGVMTGKSQRDMAQEITERFGVGASNARRLVRTESAFVANETQAKAYEECGADKYEYVAVLDMRTSKICQELDGKVFEVKDREVGVNYPPMHPYCRSTTIIHLDDETMDELESRRIARNPVTGRNEYVPADMTYEEWERRNSARGRGAGGISNADGDTVVTRLAETIDINDREAVFERLERARGEYSNLSYEKNLVIDTNGQLWELSGDTRTVDPFVLERNHGVSLEGTFSYHNHPPAETHYSFSAEDVGTFCQSGERFSMASDDKFVYYMYRPDDNTFRMSYDEGYHQFFEIYRTEYLERVRELGGVGEYDENHIIMELLSEKFGFIYQRVAL